MTGKSLVNFNSPNNIKDGFDLICHASGRTRTSVLVEMMESYILTQSKMLEVRAVELAEAHKAIEEFAILSGFGSTDRMWADEAEMALKPG